jgi:uncharacterized protein (DUF488 family)
VRVFTVGHSSLSGEAFLGLLRAHGIDVLCDVRAWPSSRRWPHFDKDELVAALAAAEIEYRWLGKELGGYRKEVRPDSPHTSLEGGWRNYADHMESGLFLEGVASLLGLARDRTVACMCAEKDWRQCHRRHIADHLVALEDAAPVFHILGPEAPQPHRLDVRARIADQKLVYDVGSQLELF